MSYIVFVVILLIVLSLISLFNTVSDKIKYTKRHFSDLDRRKRAEQAIHMRGSLHRMDPKSFQKWVADLYDKQGYRAKTMTHGDERSLLIEKDGVYFLVGTNNYVWPMSKLVVEKLYQRKNMMGLEHLIIISTSGFNLNALDWAKEQSGLELMGEEGLFALFKETESLQKRKILDPQPAT